MTRMNKLTTYVRRIVPTVCRSAKLSSGEMLSIWSFQTCERSILLTLQISSSASYSVLSVIMSSRPSKSLESEAMLQEYAGLSDAFL